MKICTKCHESKPLADFGREVAAKDGLNRRCKSCHNAIKSIYLAGNRERAREATRAWQAANREKGAAYARAYRAANPEKIRAAEHIYRAANLDSLAASHRIWRAANPEKRVATEHRRRARKRGNGIFVVTAKEIAAMLAKPCYICGAPSEHVDHIIAISRGGRHSIGNLAGACESCNMHKRTMHLIEYKRRRAAA